jgi:hydroxyacylglutathione hydrolase
MRVERLVMGDMGVNTYIIIAEDQMTAAVIDPSTASEELRDAVKGLKVEWIMNTHGHFDHIGGNQALKEWTGAGIVIHENDAEMLTDPGKNLSASLGLRIASPPADILLKGGRSEFKAAGYLFEAILVPGHTKGCVGFYQEEDKIFFSGDFIFNGAIGRTDFPGGDYRAMQASLKMIMELPDDVTVYPGHDEPFVFGDARRDLQFYLRNME